MKPFSSVMFALLFLLPLGLAAQGPVGTWKMSIPDNTGKMIPLLVNIMDNGTYAVDFGADGTIETRGKYTVDNDKMTIEDTEGSDCTGQGVYSFKVEGTTLTMTRISEGCANRGGPEGIMKMERG